MKGEIDDHFNRQNVTHVSPVSCRLKSHPLLVIHKKHLIIILMRIWNFKYPCLKTSVTSEPNEMNFLSIVSGNTLRIPTASIYNNHDAIIIIISTSQIAPASDPLPKTPPPPIQRDHLPLRLHDQSNMHPRTLHRLQRNDRQTRLARNDGGSSQLLPCGG